MIGTCRFSLGQSSGAAAWSYDSVTLVVTPEGAGPLAFSVKELAGVSGDDYTLSVRVSSGHAALLGREPGELVLSMLGHDGPTLAEALRRDWLNARQEVLRLGGTGEGWLVLGQLTGLQGETVDPFRALLHEDALVIAREGHDLEPVFLALTENVVFDESAYAVQMEEWPRRRLVFSKMAKQTDEYAKRLRENRALLAREASMTLADIVPGMAAEGRGILAGSWLPGRLLEIDRMEALCPGFIQGFRGGWLAGALRGEEGSHLLGWAAPGCVWLGCTREKADGAGEASARGSGEASARPLWMLAGRTGTWFLEPLSIEDHATYCFKGGDEVPALVSRLLCAPEFSKEALYSPLEELTGDHAGLVIPAVCIDFLVQLRSRFHGRVVHQSPESWRKEMEGLN